MIAQRSGRKAGLVLVAIAIVAAVSGCDWWRRQFQSEAERASNARRVLVAYFECSECNESQLKNAADLGEYVVPSLRVTLEQGPSNARTERQRQFLSQAHKRIVTYRQTHPGPGPAPTADDEPRFVQAFLANYKAQYQIRAATALAAIGTPDARQSLEQALQQQDLRADVRAAIGRLIRGKRGETGDGRPAVAN
jgi:hypothetical protein